MNVTHVPANLINPYNRLLAASVESEEVHCRLWSDPPRGGNPRKLLRELRSVDLVHWHWLQSFYRGKNRGSVIARGLLFLSVQMELRLRGIPQVLTVHNLMPHEHEFPELHRLMFRGIGKTVNRIVVHHPDAIDAVAALYGGRDKIRVVPHMDYGDPPSSRDRAAIRSAWDLNAYSQWVILFGSIRRYKRVECLLQVATDLSRSGIGVLLAGTCSEAAYANELEELARESGSKLVFQSLSDTDLSELLLASDVAVMPYGDALTSGAAHLALGHGLPMVATDALAFREMARLGLLITCDPSKPEDLTRGVHEAFNLRNGPWHERVNAYRQSCGLDEVGKRLLSVYREAGSD